MHPVMPDIDDVDAANRLARSRYRHDIAKFTAGAAEETGDRAGNACIR
jgi:hypothetical protein